MGEIIPLGTKLVMEGEVYTVGAVMGTKGERYYFMVGPDGSVGFLPADVVEKLERA